MLTCSRIFNLICYTGGKKPDDCSEDLHLIFPKTIYDFLEKIFSKKNVFKKKYICIYFVYIKIYFRNIFPTTRAGARQHEKKKDSGAQNFS